MKLRDFLFEQTILIFPLKLIEALKGEYNVEHRFDAIKNVVDILNNYIDIFFIIENDESGEDKKNKELGGNYVDAYFLTKFYDVEKEKVYLLIFTEWFNIGTIAELEIDFDEYFERRKRSNGDYYYLSPANAKRLVTKIINFLNNLKEDGVISYKFRK